MVMAAVLVAAILTGVGTTTAIAIALVLAGIVGLVMAARRSPRRSSAHDEIAAMMAPPKAEGVSPTRATAVEAMAPSAAKSVDPEANVPRWRRPSLLAARHHDPTREAPAYRLPMRFTGAQASDSDVRIVRYAVVPVLDRPDEVLGLRLTDLESGDEIQVVGASGAFLEVHCPNGERGWVHRTTVSRRPVDMPNAAFAPQDDEAITAPLSARGLI
jgi:membrane protein implicated in regulation of membrane protease activity